MTITVDLKTTAAFRRCFPVALPLHSCHGTYVAGILLIYFYCGRCSLTVVVVGWTVPPHTHYRFCTGIWAFTRRI